MRKPPASKTMNPITCIEYTSLAGIELTPSEVVFICYRDRCKSRDHTIVVTESKNTKQTKTKTKNRLFVIRVRNTGICYTDTKWRYRKRIFVC